MSKIRKIQLPPPIELTAVKAYRGVSMSLNFDGRQIAVVAGDIAVLEAVFKKLYKKAFTFKPEKAQQVVLFSAKDPLFNQ